MRGNAILAENISSIIAANTIAGKQFVLGSDLFVNFMPASPNNVVVIYDSGGPQAVSRQTANARIGFQVRAVNDETARAQTIAIQTLVAHGGKRGVFLASMSIGMGRVNLSPNKIGIDEHGRIRWGLDVEYLFVSV